MRRSVALLLFGLVYQSAVAGFDTVERNGGVNTSGGITYQDYDYSRSRFSTDGVGVFNPGFGTLGASLNLEGLSLSGPNFTASGSGSATFTSTYDGAAISFQGVAMVSMAGYAAIGALIGNNESNATFGATFNVATPVQALLSMKSSISTNSVLTFSIVRQDGLVVWDRVSVVSPAGLAANEFVTQLAFDPGYYTLSTRLRAMAGLDQGVPSEPATVQSAFTLAPVPEPFTSLLILIGLLQVWGVALLRRSLVKLSSIALASRFPSRYLFPNRL